MQEKTVSANNFEQCLKCNICLSVCPMMEVNPHYPGPKQAGPDGERYRIKDPRFFDLTLRYCLDCKRCEVACPSGVEVGDIIQMARLRYGKKRYPVRAALLADPDLTGNLSSSMAKVANSLTGSRLVRGVLHSAVGIHKERKMMHFSEERFTQWFSAEKQQGYGRYVTYFHGCYVNYYDPQLGKDLVKILNACGYGVHLVEDEKCCGAAMISNRLRLKAVHNAQHNVAAFSKPVRDGEAILTSGSTCSLTMRNSYVNLLGVDNSSVRDSIMLATKWLYDRLEAGDVRLAFKDDYACRIAYHTACHMQMLGWEIYSVALLRMIPGVVLSVPEQRCCGLAGTFGYKKENYTYSQMIGMELFSQLKAEAADVVATECESCKWQIESGAALKVMNPISIIAEALDVQKTKELNDAVR